MYALPSPSLRPTEVASSRQDVSFPIPQGPNSRALLSKVVDDLDLSNDGFPFMACAECTVFGGTPARLFRISFSGELAYEIAVPARYGDSMIRGLMKAGVFGLVAAETAAETRQSDKIATLPVMPKSASVDAPRPDRLAAYPMLRGVVRYGKAGGIAISVAAAALVLWLLWPVLENWAIPIAAAAGLLAGVVALSFVELVRLITDLLLPG